MNDENNNITPDKKPSSAVKSLAGVGGVLITIYGLVTIPSTLSTLSSSTGGFSFGTLLANGITLALGIYLVSFSVKKTK